MLGVALLPAIIVLGCLSLWEGPCVYNIKLIVTVILQLLHLRCLYKSTLYFNFCRILVIQIRVLVVPFVIYVSRIESIREQAPTLYFDTKDSILSDGSNENEPEQHMNMDDDNGSLRTPLLSSTRRTTPQQSSSHPRQSSRKIRRRYAQMQRAFERDGITHKADFSDRILNLSTALPILWEHERRITSNFFDALVESLKRYLVLVCMPLGILDCYYDRDGELVAIQLSVLVGSVWHWFIYLSKDSATKSGIWFHGIGTAQQRALSFSDTDFCNAQVHQTQSKKNAGCLAACHDDSELLSELYSFQLPQRPPDELLNVSLWTRTANVNGSSQDPAQQDPVVPEDGSTI